MYCYARAKIAHVSQALSTGNDPRANSGLTPQVPVTGKEIFDYTNKVKAIIYTRIRGPTVGLKRIIITQFVLRNLKFFGDDKSPYFNKPEPIVIIS